MEREHPPERGFDYIKPVVDDLCLIEATEDVPKARNFNIRLPSRISLPLAQVPDVIPKFLNDGMRPLSVKLQPSVFAHLKLAKHEIELAQLEGKIRKIHISHDLEAINRVPFVNLGSMLAGQSSLAQEVLHSALHLELCQFANTKDIRAHTFSRLPIIPDFLALFRRLAATVSSLETKNQYKESSARMAKTRVTFSLSPTKVLMSEVESDHGRFVVMMMGSWIIIDDPRFNHLCLFTQVELDYMITLAEVVLNIDIIKQVNEHNWANPLLKYLRDLLLDRRNHNHKVDFMKSYEAVCLMSADFVGDKFFSWQPVLETLEGMHRLDLQMGAEDYHPGLAVLSFFKVNFDCPPESILVALGQELSKLSPLRRAEISTLHKCAFYAITTALPGFMKFVQRTHTPRPFQRYAVERICARFNKNVICNYTKRHHVLPEIRGPDYKKVMLSRMMDSGDLRGMSSLALMWWVDVIAFGCISQDVTHDPLEYAKDKGALKPAIRFGPGDSEREIIQVIQEQGEPIFHFDWGAFRYPCEQTCRRIRPLPTPIVIPFPARGIAKEREQKPMPRLFANSTIENKRIMSRYMLLAKKVLSYIDDEFMTITDKERKIRLHRAAQLLNSPDNYAIMLDIEGHNQSMQFENTGPLLELIGLACGEEGWANLAKYFNNLTYYMYDEYEDCAWVSTGQLGGIEGWMNPVWGMHTTLMVKDFFERYNLDCRFLGDYSDDVASVVHIPDMSDEKADEIYGMLQDYCIDFGMIVKPAQTMISGVRLTLLRRHYVLGEFADSTLKRSVAISMFNNEFVANDELEVNAVCSTANSALELANHVLTPTVIKLYRCIYLGMRVFAAFFDGDRKLPWVTEGILGHRFFNTVWPLGDGASIVEEIGKEKSVQIFREQLVEMAKTAKRSIPEEAIAGMGIDMTDYAMGKTLDLQLRDMIYLMTAFDSHVRELFLYRLYLPQSLGGLGVPTLLTQAITGQSESLQANLCELKDIADNYVEHPEIWYEGLRWALSNHRLRIAKGHGLPGLTPIEVDDDYEYYDDYGETALLTNTWPCSNSLRTTQMILKAAVMKFIKDNCKSPRIIRLRDFDATRKSFSSELLEIMREKFHPRIASFYMEHSAFHIMDKLVKKVENPSAFLKQLKGVHSLRNRLYKSSLTAIMICFSKREKDYGVINRETAIPIYLSDRRSSMFPKITFLKAPGTGRPFMEPNFVTLAQKVPYGDELGTVMVKRVKQYKSGLLSYGDPHFGSEALYKGEVSQYGFIYKCIEERLIFELTAVTKWMTYRSHGLEDHPERLESNNLIDACNLSMSTLTTHRYSELADRVPTTPGGEVLHRLPNYNYVSGAAIRVLPLATQAYTARINETTISERDWGDSNLHFDYIRLRMILHATACSLYSNNRYLTCGYALKEPNEISDVRVDYTLPSSGRTNYTAAYLSRVEDLTDIRRRLRYIAAMPSLLLGDEWAQQEDIDYSISDPQSMAEEYVLSYARARYSGLTREYSILSFARFQMRHWADFIASYKSVMATWRSMSDDEILSWLETQLRIKLQYEMDRTQTSHSAILLDNLKKDLEAALPRFAEEQHAIDSYCTRAHSWAGKTRRQKLTADERLRAKGLIEERYRLSVRATKWFLQQLIIRYAGVFCITDREIVLDIGLTRARLSMTVSGSDLLIDDQDSLLSAQVVLGLGNEHLTDERLQHDAVRSVMKLLEEMPLDYYVMTHESSIPKVRQYLDPMDMMRNDLCMHACTTALVGPEIITEFETFKKVIDYRRLICNIYSNPDVFASDTGSDTYVAAHSVLNSLIQEGHINADTLIIDSTAGRGDFARALERQRLNFESYARRDMYTMFRSDTRVRIVDQYDIFGLENCDFVYKGDLIIIDISFVKGPTRDISSTIVNLLMINKLVLVRLNSIQLDQAVFLESDTLRRTSMKLYYLQDGSFAHPNMYLFFDPLHFPYIRPNQGLRRSTWFSSLAKGVMRVSMQKNLFSLGTPGTPNSMTELVESVLSDPDMPELLLQGKRADQLRSYIRRLDQEIILLEGVVVSPAHGPPGLRDKWRSIGRRLPATQGPFYVGHRASFPGMTTGRAHDYRVIHLNHLQEEVGEHIIIDPFNIQITDLRDLRSNHPSARVRSTLNALIQLMDGEHIRPPRNSLELDTALRELEVALPARADKLSRTVRLALMYKIYFDRGGTGRGSMQYTLYRYISGGLTKSEFTTLASILKKLACLTPRQMRALKDISEIRGIRDSIKELELESSRRRTQREQRPRKPDVIERIGTDQDTGELLFPEGFLDAFMGMIDRQAVVTVNTLSINNGSLRIDTHNGPLQAEDQHFPAVQEMMEKIIVELDSADVDVGAETGQVADDYPEEMRRQWEEDGIEFEVYQDGPEFYRGDW